MLKHLFEWLNKNGIDLPGDNLFQFITSRVMLAMLLSLIISSVFGKKIINYLRSLQVGESVRDLGLAGEQEKKGTPTMGGIIIILAIIIPTILLADISKVYILLMLFATLWMGFIGFVDDYLKLRAKKIAKQKGLEYKKGDNDGLAGWFKVLGQVVLGIAVATTLLFNDTISVYREFNGSTLSPDASYKKVQMDGKEMIMVKADEPITTIPFVRNHEFNYSKLLPQAMRGLTWIFYILIVVFIVTAVSNGANITDGIDGLATGVSAIIGVGLGVFAYASGNYRQFDAGWSDCFAGFFGEKRIADSYFLWCVSGGESECRITGQLF